MTTPDMIIIAVFGGLNLMLTFAAWRQTGKQLKQLEDKVEELIDDLTAIK